MPSGFWENVMTPTHVLVVDDDADIRAFVRHALEREGMVVSVADSKQAMEVVLADDVIDILLLDVRLPDADGFDLLRDLRQTMSLPVIMLTGMDTPTDRVLGLEFGADDYLGKPVDPKELAARVRNVLGRSRVSRTQEIDEPSEKLTFADFTVDPTRRALSRTNGENIDLTGAEFDLLCALAQAPNRPLSRDQLVDQTRRRDWTPFDRSVDVLVGRLRKKIEGDPKRPELIKSVRGVGYVFSERVKRISG